jgi:hypothetical protein
MGQQEIQEIVAQRRVAPFFSVKPANGRHVKLGMLAAGIRS